MIETKSGSIDAQRERARIKVLYIGGYLRVGSTLLDRTLGQVEGFYSAGEIRHIWEESFAEDQPCGCGKPFAECSFWQDVVEMAYGGFDQVDLEEAIWLKRHVDRMRYIPQLMLPKKGSGYSARFAKYSENLVNLYSAIREVSGSRVIIDSSKDASYAYALANLQNIDLHVIHLVRDSRAVAHSWLRKKIKYELKGKEKVYMDQRGPVGSSVGWMRSNLLIESLKPYAARYMTVRYEDFVAAPRPILRDILGLLGEEVRDLPVTASRTVCLGTNHTVAGNSNRFRRGSIELSLDEEWKARMSRADRRTVTALTWPLLLKYGYLGEKVA